MMGTGEMGTAGLPNLWPLALCLGSIYVVFVATNLYGLRGDSDSVRYAAEHGLACVLAFALALLLQFAVFIFDLSRSRMALTAAFLVFTPLALAYRRILGRSFRVRAETQSFLIIGAGTEAIRFYRACRENGTAQSLRFVDLSGARAGGKAGWREVAGDRRGRVGRLCRAARWIDRGGGGGGAFSNAAATKCGEPGADPFFFTRRF